MCRKSTPGIAVVASIALLGTSSSLLKAGEPEANDLSVLAWARFDDGPETYAKLPYHWLGRVNLEVSIDVAPAPGHVLELHWGSKSDRRTAFLSVGGETLTIEAGGYDGYQWQRVALPQGLSGDKYAITLTGGGKPAFLAGIRLLGPKNDGTEDAEAGAAAWRMTVVTTRPKPVPAFPQMQAIWEREPDGKSPLPDAELEAAFRRAEKNARRAAEMFYRCRRFVDGWMAQADPVTKLIPRNLTRNRDIWNAKDSAADNYPFMVLTCALTDRGLFEGRMREMLRTETRLTSRIDRLPDTYSFSKQGFQSDEADLDSIIFGGSEYVKDGLLPLTEWLGESPWSERMLGIVDDIWKHAPVDTPYGKICSTNVEVNGEMLQALSRIYWMTGDEKYLDWAIRLGDYYLLGEHHPTGDTVSLRLRDHGCEIVSGLSEVYAAVNFARPEKKKAYEAPIHAAFDRVLEVGRNEHGMLYDTINPQTGEHSERICDTWGYNYNGVYTVYLIDGTESYRQAVRHVLGELEQHLTDYHWGSADEYADSIEGAINLYNREPVASAARWIDTEIDDMWSVQKPDGVVEGWHGDGNSARTAIMYALWKTRGTHVQPWREDVRVGADDWRGGICISLSTDEAYEGRIFFDRERHKVQMGMPLDYPRINQFPEWFTVESGNSYVVENVDSGETRECSGEELLKGLPVELAKGEELRLTIIRKP